MDDFDNKPEKCNKCDFKCENADTLQKHKWKWHPKNNYEKIMVKTCKRKF